MAISIREEKLEALIEEILEHFEPQAIGNDMITDSWNSTGGFAYAQDDLQQVLDSAREFLYGVDSGPDEDQDDYEPSYDNAD